MNTRDGELDAVARVWGDAWKWQRDHPFAIGSEVDWRLVPFPHDMPWGLYDVLGNEAWRAVMHPNDARRAVTHFFEGSLWGGETRAMRRVRSIEAVHWASTSDVMYPVVAGSSVFEERQQATGSEPERREDGLWFAGYIVELAPMV